ncbi:FAD-binding oxidoreductase [Streptomyces globisporus]|uniref:NAD(P)/FAD-dependent oxidoreductase n=1 Tax=Streptomyces globisporus TaxID=1908 RepID=UPI003867EF3D|nr:FAD-binding oxidoreductase [Streptomyces globisporus]
MTTTDVVVVGAGVVGTSTALELSRAGFSVTVVDRASAPGHGSTSASSAVIRYNYSTWEGMAAAWESKFRWENWEEHLGIHPSSRPAAFIPCGLAFVDVEIMPRERQAALLGAGGIPHQIWGPSKLATRIPGIDVGRYWPPKPVTSEEFFADAAESLGAIYTPDAGFVNDPQLAAANLAEAAAHHGATFLFRREVVAIDRVSPDWRVTLGDGSVVHAPILVNAAGPWSSKLNRLAGIGGDFTVEIAPLRQEVHHVPAPPRLGDEVPIIVDADLGIYVRPDSGGNLLIGGTEPACDPLEWIDDPDTADPNPTVARFEAQILRGARRLPDLGVPNRPRGIAGVYDVASDWTPIYDRTESDGYFVAMGTSGNQFKNAPLVGSLMLAIIEGVQRGHDHDADPITYTAPHTGHRIDLGAFSRKRPLDSVTSGTVLG